MAELTIGRQGAIAPIETPQPVGQQARAAAMAPRKPTESLGDAGNIWEGAGRMLNQAGALGLLTVVLAWGGPKLFEKNREVEESQKKTELYMEKSLMLLDSMAKTLADMADDTRETKNFVKGKSL